jgi:lysophospholipase L1-like esterase
MRDALCDGKYCYAVINGELMYADPDHPSRLGAELIAERLWPQLSRR